MVRTTLVFLGALTLQTAVGGCGDGKSSEGGDSMEGGDALPDGCDALVEPGEDDQTALQGALLDAEDGSTVCLAAGTFRMNGELSVSADGLTLRGASRDATILDFSTQDLGGNGIKVSGDNVTVTALTVQDTPGDGVRGDDVENITFDDVAVVWTAPASVENGAYGFYPIGCDGVVIRNSLVVGARDAGVYVGQSKNIIVEDNEAHGNVAGIEIENSTDATVRRNHAHDNTAGILIFNLPKLPVGDGKRTLAYDNVVENNNLDNFAEPGTIVSEVSPGIGFMILASDYNELRANEISGNKTTGVVIVQYNEALFGAYDDPEFDIYAQGNFVDGNRFMGNGADPDKLLRDLTGDMVPLADILLDGCSDPARDNTDRSLDNCLSDNGAATYLNLDVCGAFQDQTSDIEAVTCEHASLMPPK